MEAIWEFYLAHAFWSWIAFAAVLLAAEVATGTGNLLWPAGCAAAVAVFAASSYSPGLPAEVGLFALLTIAAVLISRRVLKKAVEPEGPNLNDPAAVLVGAHGRVVGGLEAEGGRVFAGGKEWAALLEGGGRLEDGATVEVVGVEDGSTLRVRKPKAPGGRHA